MVLELIAHKSATFKGRDSVAKVAWVIVVRTFVLSHAFSVLVSTIVAVVIECAASVAWIG